MRKMREDALIKKKEQDQKKIKAMENAMRMKEFAKKQREIISNKGSRAGSARGSRVKVESISEPVSLPGPRANSARGSRNVTTASTKTGGASKRNETKEEIKENQDSGFG